MVFYALCYRSYINNYEIKVVWNVVCILIGFIHVIICEVKKCGIIDSGIL